MQTGREKQLRVKLLKKLQECLIYDPNHSIELSSGRLSNFFIDCRRITLDNEGAFLTGSLISDAISFEEPDAIGGVTLGADPLVTSVGILTLKDPSPVPGFIIRKDPKPFTRPEDPSAFIEGNLKTGSRVVIVDDVLTTGNSLLQGIELVEKTGCTIIKIVALVDRMEGAREMLESKGYRVE
ncbi:MAG TPA: phosphoribosyltransferase family protein, partial [Nitrospiria bacterium]